MLFTKWKRQQDMWAKVQRHIKVWVKAVPCSVNGGTKLCPDLSLSKPWFKSMYPELQILERVKREFDRLHMWEDTYSERVHNQTDLQRTELIGWAKEILMNLWQFNPSPRIYSGGIAIPAALYGNDANSRLGQSPSIGVIWSPAGNVLLPDSSVVRRGNFIQCVHFICLHHYKERTPIHKHCFHFKPSRLTFLHQSLMASINLWVWWTILLSCNFRF